MLYPHTLDFVWLAIIAFGVVMYVVLDGFTLGTGMLLPFMDKPERDIAASVVLPTWDGNQTWLVLGGASLYGAFPLAFSLILPALYVPIVLMVLGLLFRGVAFEFRLKSTSQAKFNWDTVLFIASLLVTLIQGLIMGNFVEGFVFSTQPYFVSTKGFFSPFALFAALSLVCGYLLLGSTRLILKTEGKLRAKMYRISFWLALMSMVCMIVISVWTPAINQQVFARWFEHYNWIYLSILPYVAGLAFIILLRALYIKDDKLPYYCTVVLFLCGYLGFLVSLYPYIVPYQLTYYAAAAPDSTLGFLLVGAIIMLPVLLIYTGYSYHIFRGKVKRRLGY